MFSISVNNSVNIKCILCKDIVSSLRKDVEKNMFIVFVIRLTFHNKDVYFITSTLLSLDQQ